MNQYRYVKTSTMMVNDGYKMQVVHGHQATGDRIKKVMMEETRKRKRESD